MSKRGIAFVHIINYQQLRPAVWDPHGYSDVIASERLGQYIEVNSLRRLGSAPRSLFRAIEYSDISRSDHLTFNLEVSRTEEKAKLCAVGELELLLGTMRAYLGNIIVMPRAEWLGLAESLTFAVKSEFVRLVPRDGLVYFWWAYLRSPMFLTKLPTGSGGTRPRLQPAALAATTVNVPKIEKRAAIHHQLEECAAREWQEMLYRRTILDSLRSEA